MSYVVVDGATISCSGEVAQGTCRLTVLNPMIKADNSPTATIMDNIPFLNIASFGQCNLSSNPMVAAATAAALGVHTPQKCIPMTVAPWTPGSSKVTANFVPVLTNNSILMCLWGGTITVKNAGQTIVQA